MCVYSMVSDHYWDKLTPWQIPPNPIVPTFPLIFPPIVPPISDLQKLIKEMEELLVKAKKYDEDNKQKECDLEEKKERIRKLCKELGVEVNFP